MQHPLVYSFDLTFDLSLFTLLSLSLSHTHTHLYTHTQHTSCTRACVFAYTFSLAQSLILLISNQANFCTRSFIHLYFFAHTLFSLLSYIRHVITKRFTYALMRTTRFAQPDKINQSSDRFMINDSKLKWIDYLYRISIDASRKGKKKAMLGAYLSRSSFVASSLYFPCRYEKNRSRSFG